MNNVPMVAPLPLPPFAGMFSSQDDVGPPKSILIHGDEGTHKSTIAAEIIKVPGIDKVLVIDIDNGSEVYVNDPVIHSAVGTDLGLPGQKRINIVKIDITDPNAFGMLDYIMTAVLASNLGYQAVILDTIDVGQESVIDEKMATTFNESNKLDTRAAWGQISKHLSKWMWGFQNTPYFTGITLAHSRGEIDKASGKFKVKPKLSGGIKDNIASIPSLVVYLEKREDDKTHQTRIVATVGESAVITAKNRYRLPKEMEDFSFPKFYSIIGERLAASRAHTAAQQAPLQQQYLQPPALPTAFDQVAAAYAMPSAQPGQLSPAPLVPTPTTNAAQPAAQQ